MLDRTSATSWPTGEPGDRGVLAAQLLHDPAARPRGEHRPRLGDKSSCSVNTRTGHDGSSSGRCACPTCPIPEIAKLGRTLKQWRDAYLAYFDTGRASNGGTESINGLIELHRRIARGFRNRDNYRLRMLLIGGGLTPPPPPEV